MSLLAAPESWSAGTDSVPWADGPRAPFLFSCLVTESGQQVTQGGQEAEPGVFRPRPRLQVLVEDQAGAGQRRRPGAVKDQSIEDGKVLHAL